METHSQLLQVVLLVLVTLPITLMVPTAPGTLLWHLETSSGCLLLPSTWNTILIVIWIMWRYMTMARFRLGIFWAGESIFSSTSVGVTQKQFITQFYNLFIRYCGRSVPPSLTSTDNLMTVLFVTDSSMATEGFAANYVSIDASTGRI